MLATVTFLGSYLCEPVGCAEARTASFASDLRRRENARRPGNAPPPVAGHSQSSLSGAADLDRCGSFLTASYELGLAKRVKAKIFQASTSAVCGDLNIHPQPEHDWGNVNPIGPRSCYDEGKRCAETLFKEE